MKIVLVHPPLDDPTLPYHSAAYLAGHLVHCGFTDVAIRDVNIEFVNWTFEPRVFSSFHEETERRLRGFEQKTALSYPEQDEYLGLWRQRPVSFDALQRAVAGLRDRDSFLSFPDYKSFRATMLDYMEMLGALSYPGGMTNFMPFSLGRFSKHNFRDLFDETLAARICQIFGRYLEERLATDAELSAADCIGISIVYDHQMFHALHMARWAKRRWPEKQVLLGGTAISQLYKNIRDKQLLKAFFSVCDGIVVGEGETALCQLADAGGHVVPGMKVHNLISYDRAADRLHLPEFVHYENVAALGRPLFHYPWELYLSPERGINYSPTRGCYWNRCTFCDYGLNTLKPTSPWRERRIDQVIDDLRATAEETGARFVYFAVDVMSPAYLDRLSDAILDAGLDIRWSAELRMERVFSQERCEKLAASGCVCASFGMESGSQRILDLIDKGTQVAFMGETMKNFAAAGIAVQIMAFAGFPSETRDEREQTRRFVIEHEPYWSAGGVGTFMLTSTAIVARDPARFGVRLLERQDADFQRMVDYEIDQDSRDDESRAMLTEECDASFDSHGNIFPQFLGRPWAGGTDSLHSMIYYDVYGRSFFRENPAWPANGKIPSSTEQLRSCELVLTGVVRDSPFDIGKILAGRRSMAEYRLQLSRVPREPSQAAFQQWAASRPGVPSGADRKHWYISGFNCVRLDPFIYQLLSSHAQPVTLDELVKPFDDSLADKLLRYFQQLAQRGLVDLKPPKEAVRGPVSRIPFLPRGQTPAAPV